MKKALFLILAFLFLARTLILMLLTYPSLFGVEMPTKVVEIILLSSNHTYLLIMKYLSIVCGVILIVLSRKSNLRFIWILGAICSGTTWLLIYYGTTLYRFTESSKPSFPPMLKIFVLAVAVWGLILQFIPISLSTISWRSASIMVNMLIIRATLTFYCYQVLLKRKALFSVLCFIFGTTALLAGQAIAIVTHKKQPADPC